MSSLNVAGLVLAAMMSSMNVPVDTKTCEPKSTGAAARKCDVSECEKCPDGTRCPDPAKCPAGPKCAAAAKARKGSSARLQAFVPVAAVISK